MTSPKILLLDIESAPGLGYSWTKWDTNIIKFVQDWYLLCFSVKWLGDKKIWTYSLPGYKDSYRKSKTDDHLLCKELWRYFDEADVICAHNGQAFDLKKSNARFIAHGMMPPSPYQVLDTLLMARKYFAFSSNKLADLAEYFDLGHKVPHSGFSLWEKCMAGDEDAWKTMRSYNAMDVRLLEEVYLLLRPWATNHTNLSVFNGNNGGCPTCQSVKVQRRGLSYTKTTIRRRMHCTSCGSWFPGAIIKKGTFVNADVSDEDD